MSHRDGTTAQAKEYQASTDRPGALSPTPESGRHPNPRKDKDISQSVAVAIGALFATSCLLRILFVFLYRFGWDLSVDVTLSEACQQLSSSTLPSISPIPRRCERVLGGVGLAGRGSCYRFPERVRTYQRSSEGIARYFHLTV